MKCVRFCWRSNTLFTLAISFEIVFKAHSLWFLTHFTCIDLNVLCKFQETSVTPNIIGNSLKITASDLFYSLREYIFRFLSAIHTSLAYNLCCVKRFDWIRVVIISTSRFLFTLLFNLVANTLAFVSLWSSFDALRRNLFRFFFPSLQKSAFIERVKPNKTVCLTLRTQRKRSVQ